MPKLRKSSIAIAGATLALGVGGCGSQEKAGNFTTPATTPTTPAETTPTTPIETTPQPAGQDDIRLLAEEVIRRVATQQNKLINESDGGSEGRKTVLNYYRDEGDEERPPSITIDRSEGSKLPTGDCVETTQSVSIDQSIVNPEQISAVTVTKEIYVGACVVGLTDELTSVDTKSDGTVSTETEYTVGQSEDGTYTSTVAITENQDYDNENYNEAAPVSENAADILAITNYVVTPQ